MPALIGIVLRIVASMPLRQVHPAAVRKGRILLAEDNAVNQRVALGILRRHGHDVVVVADGARAMTS